MKLRIWKEHRIFTQCAVRMLDKDIWKLLFWPYSASWEVVALIEIQQEVRYFTEVNRSLTFDLCIPKPSTQLLVGRGFAQKHG